jgi:hypothetical protein
MLPFKSMKKRRPFILMEVLIAIALLALCLIPIASAPFRHYTKQTHALKQMELERLSDVVYRDFLKLLPELTSFEALPTSRKDALRHEWGPYTFSIEGCGTYSYMAKCRFWIKAPENPEKYGLLRMEIRLADRLFTYDLFIEKK